MSKKFVLDLSLFLPQLGINWDICEFVQDYMICARPSLHVPTFHITCNSVIHISMHMNERKKLRIYIDEMEIKRKFIKIIHDILINLSVISNHVSGCQQEKYLSIIRSNYEKKSD